MFSVKSLRKWVFTATLISLIIFTFSIVQAASFPNVNTQIAFIEGYEDAQITSDPAWIQGFPSFYFSNGQFHSDGTDHDSSDRYWSIYNSDVTILADDYLELSYEGMLKSVGSPQAGRGIHVGLRGQVGGVNANYILMIQNGNAGGSNINEHSISLVYTSPGGVPTDLIVSNFVPNFDQWYEVKAIRENGVWTLYADENPLGSANAPYHLPNVDQVQMPLVGSVAVDNIVVKIESDEELPLLSDFVVLGQEGVYLKQGATVISGDVGSNTTSSGPYLAGSQELTVGQSVSVQSLTSQIFGDSIKIKQNGQVYDVGYNDLDNNGTILGIETSPLNLPIIANLPLLPTFNPSTDDVFVAQGGTLNITPGSYGVLDANKNSTLTFTGGVYDFEEWDIGSSVDIFFTGVSEIRIADKLHIDKNSYAGPNTGSGLVASDIVFYINGVNGNNGNLGATPKAAKFGVNSIIFANVYVPNGTLWLRQGSSNTGSFLAKWVIVGINANVTLENGW